MGLDPAHKGVMIAFVRLMEPSREPEFHRYYRTMHISDVLETPGVTSGHRFVDARGDGDEDRKWFLIYEVDDGDVNAVARRLPETFARKQGRNFDALKMTHGANFRRIL